MRVQFTYVNGDLIKEIDIDIIPRIGELVYVEQIMRKEVFVQSKFYGFPIMKVKRVALCMDEGGYYYCVDLSYLL